MAESKKFTTTKEEAKKIGTLKTEQKKISTTKAEPVNKRLTTKKNSGNANVYVQCLGQEIDVSKLVKRIEDVIDNTKTLNIYIKPEESKAYYTCGEAKGILDL